jgi:hypothetical protein
VGVEAGGVAIWQAAKPSIMKTARDKIHFEKPGPPLIKVSLRLIQHHLNNRITTA